LKRYDSANFWSRNSPKTPREAELTGKFSQYKFIHIMLFRELKRKRKQTGTLELRYSNDSTNYLHGARAGPADLAAAGPII